MKRIYAVYIYITIFVFALYAEPQKTPSFISQFNTWKLEHPLATQEELITFLETYIPTIPTVQDIYTVLNSIFTTYPDSIIPYTVYELFAQYASLKFDFTTAALMYQKAYKISDNPKYLFYSAVHEFQLGNLETASDYLTNITKNYSAITDTLLPKAYILQSELFLLEETPEVSYRFLENAQYKLSEQSIDAGFLYQLYRLAILSENDNEAYLIHRALLKHFPNAIETSTIDENNISALPLPHLLLNIPPFFSTSSTIPTKETQSPRLRENTSTIFSQAPAVGYQVGAFSNIQNARNTLTYYTDLWSRNKISSPSPIIVKTSIENTIFYQIIFPLNEQQEIYNKQSLILKEYNIEGFLIVK